MSLNILLLEDVHASATPILHAVPGAEILRLKHAPDAHELESLLADVQVLGLRSRTQLNRDMLARAPRLLAVGAYCTGTNNIDLKAASERGVVVFNGPFSNTRSVAELVIGHAIHLLRRIPERHAAARRGQWLKDSRGSNEIRGKTLGIIGYGKIGMQTGLLAEAIGMRVVYHDIEARLPLGNATPATTLTALLQEADVVTLHVPQTERTRLLIAAERLAQMKPDAVLINLARGHAVDLDALHVALGAHRLRGAAIDVFPTEPTSNAAVFESPLRELDNVILTPHVGGSTAEAQHNRHPQIAGAAGPHPPRPARRDVTAQRRAGSSRLQCVAAAPGDRRRLRRCGDRPEPAAGQRHARRGGGRRGNRARLHGARARLMPCKS